MPYASRATMLPPGFSMLPQMAFMAIQACAWGMPLTFMSTATPHCMALGLPWANRRAALRMSSAGIHVTFEASSGDQSLTLSTSWSKP